MQYKIYKKLERGHKLNYETNLYEPTEKTLYFIRRKGRVFGFMHNVGDTICLDLSGESFTCLNFFETVEQAKSYLYCWHKEKYGDEKIEIVETVNL